MLNNDDIETLMEALDALEQKAGRDGFSMALLSMSLIPDREKAKEEADKEIKGFIYMFHLHSTNFLVDILS